MRSYFYGALLAPAFHGNSASQLPDKLAVSGSALLHIKCFSENSTPIIGNATKQIGADSLATAQEACLARGVGTVHNVWGHRALLGLANELEA